MKTEPSINESSADFEIKRVVDRIRGLGEILAHDRDGKMIFRGSLAQLKVVLKNKDLGDFSQVGDISDKNGTAIVRFGASDGSGFINRSRALDFVQKITQSEDLRGDTKNELRADHVRSALMHGAESRDMLLLLIKDAYKKIYFSNRWGFRDGMFLCSKNQRVDGTYYESVDGSVGQFFDAHGITKGDQLNSLLTLLEKGIDSSREFYTAPFELSDDVRAAVGSVLGTAGGTAYKDGIAILVSGYNQSLIRDGIKHVFVNDYVGGLIEPLRRAFPQYQFHLLSEQKHVLESDYIANKK